MLSLLQVHQTLQSQRLAQRVRFADDLESLWYLRQDLVSGLSQLEGELVARRHMTKINALFKGGLPNTMGPRVHQRFPV
jgi:hypothetical protein